MIPRPTKPDPIADAASQWVVRLEHGLTPEEQDRFLDWLTADDRHGAELNRQQANWGRLDVLADWRPEHGQRPNRDLLAPEPQPVRWAQTHWRTLATAGLLAACLAVGFFFRSRSAEPAPAPARIAVIEERKLVDGSTIELNRGAAVTVDYQPAARHVRLEQGEANFKVAKDSTRPFIVSVWGVEVRAVGTAFNVRLDRQAVEVVVTEGKVQVDHGTLPPSFVSANERVLVPLAGAGKPAVAAVNSEEIARLVAWQPTWLDFTDTPLDAITAEFNRRNAPIRLVIADAELAETRLSATLRSDNIENFLGLLEGGFNVEAERSGHAIILRKRAKP